MSSESFRDFFLLRPVAERVVDPANNAAASALTDIAPPVSAKQHELDEDLAHASPSSAKARPMPRRELRTPREVVDKVQAQLAQGFYIEAQSFVKWVVDHKGHLVLDLRDSPAEGYVLATDIPTPPKTPRGGRAGVSLMSAMARPVVPCGRSWAMGDQ